MTVPTGTFKRATPKTPEQARRLFSNDKIKNLTKLKMQEYINSFFDKADANYSLLSAVSPRFIHYNTDKSFDPRVDPTQRQLQIARYFTKLRSVFPAILIVDGGVNPMQQSIGLISDAYVKNGVWQGVFPIFRSIPMSIIAAARDVDEADEMSGVLSLMFNEMRNLAGGQHIVGKQDEGENWVITLPNAGVAVGALSESEVQDDPLEKIWYSETVIEVFFEDKLQITQQMPQIEFGGMVVGSPELRQKLKPVITVPDQIKLNEQVKIYIQYFQNHYRVILSDSTVATLTYNMILTPRKFGKVKIQVYDEYANAKERRIIAEKEVEIVP